MHLCKMYCTVAWEELTSFARSYMDLNLGFRRVIFVLRRLALENGDVSCDEILDRDAHKDLFISLVEELVLDHRCDALGSPSLRC